MSRNDADDFTQRLYARIPENYRVYDQEQGLPLLALVQVVAEQVANVRQNLDELWDDFFIETCQDWIVPYIGALVGTNLLAEPVARSNRLEVRDTVSWRRGKGTVAMLAALANEISGWSADIAEFAWSLGWSQNMNHLRLDRPLTANLRDPYAMSLLGRAGDPFAHAADVRPGHDLDQARVTSITSPFGRASWGTPGRYRIDRVGFFVRRLSSFQVSLGTPAAADPGSAPPAGASWFTFDPLHRELPLFTSDAAPMTRAAFGHAPERYFGTDVTVRQFGIPLAITAAPQTNVSSSTTPFSFGGAVTIALDPRVGIRLLEPDSLRSGSAHFVISALWQGSAGSAASLGTISTLLAARNDPGAYRAGVGGTGVGHLVITVTTGRPGLGFTLPASPATRFPGAVVAVRASRAGALHVDDARYVYLPAAFVAAGSTLVFHAADDGSTYVDSSFTSASLARGSEGQVFPAVVQQPSAEPATTVQLISRMPGAMQLADASRVAGAALLIQAELFTGVFQPQGAIATVDQPAASFANLLPPADPWRALTYAPARSLPPDNVPGALLAIFVRPLSGSFVPSCELIVRGRNSDALLVFLPEIPQCPSTGVRVFVADDGSTWTAPVNPQMDGTLDGGDIARAGTGQAMPIPGNWPLQYRRPVAIDLCRSERTALLRPGELGIDPERGRFALAAADPAIGSGGFTVDYAEGFADRVGALTYDRMLDPNQAASRVVSRFGETTGTLPVYSTVAAAVAAAADGDIIEIADSATYSATAAIPIGNAQVKRLTIRAASGQRPCLTFFRAASVNSFHVTVPMAALEFNGLLISGGAVLVEQPIADLRFEACTLDPRFGPSLVTTDPDLTGTARYLVCRCIAGALQLGNGVGRVIIADSIIDGSGSFAIAGLPGASSPPHGVPTAARSLQLERATVLGRIHCDVLVASESILDDIVVAEDRQSGCIRFSRYEAGSVLPRRFQCVPSEADAAASPPGQRCLAASYNSRRFDRPDYAQLAVTTPAQIVTASEAHSEIGAFSGALNTIRLANLRTKLTEFMPVGLEPAIIAET